MKLSVIVPVYNMASDGKLNYCLDSLLNQNLEKGSFEVIAVDDASTDESAEILRQYAEKFPISFRTVFSEENRRQGGAKNLGLKVATGEWIGFVDSDDWVHPDMYRKLLAAAEHDGSDCAGCQYCLTDEHSLKIGKVVNVHNERMAGDMDGDVMKEWMLGPGSMVVKIYKASVIRENDLHFPEHTFYEDNYAATIWMSCFKRFSFVNEALYYYYQHGSSTVHTVDMQRLNNRMDMAVKMLQDTRRAGLHKKFKNEIELNFIRIYYINTLFSYMQITSKSDMGFLRTIRNGIKEYVPDYLENPYLNEYFNSEQLKFARIHRRSAWLFNLCYRSLFLYRKLRK